MVNDLAYRVRVCGTIRAAHSGLSPSTMLFYFTTLYAAPCVYSLLESRLTLTTILSLLTGIPSHSSIDGDRLSTTDCVKPIYLSSRGEFMG